MKQSDFLRFFPKEVSSLISKETPFRLEGLTPSLFPLIYPLFSKRLLVFYDGVDIESCLSLFVESEGVFYDSHFSPEKGGLEGFSGAGEGARDLFLSSLREGFKNSSVVFFPFNLKSSPLFKRYDIVEGFSVKRGVSHSRLVSLLSSLGYVSCEYVEACGEFASRGMVVDFLPRSSSWGFGPFLMGVPVLLFLNLVQKPNLWFLRWTLLI